MQVLNYIAGGRDIASGVSYICQGIIRGPAVPLVKRLAYDVVHAAALTDADWDNVLEGLKSDLAGTFSLEVHYLFVLTIPITSLKSGQCSFEIHVIPEVLGHAALRDSKTRSECSNNYLTYSY